MAALTSFGILEREGELRGASEPSGYVPDRADFDEHIRTYRAFKKILLIAIAHIAVLLALMGFFLVG
ncbi:aa3-type cytochrome c oxidase subunit IV [Hyphomicrobium sp.]|uniref:aa3-type cytochrome c oxidase subunit IV n=1 Tax=Hyphomicrobium sp. TaxID=82 RepID=UPI002C612350|nr:aa3-type cytochrome c oxidase subunit IV [Hyphomicrobium sp.]HVZ05639.1 aa3-type cytochrome c oxidase subunit IV [Hyphomicrobium sp.]